MRRFGIGWAFLGLAGAVRAQQWSLWLERDGAAANDSYGQALSEIGDLDGDGHADLLVGVYGADWNGSGSGGVEALSGNTGAVLYQRAGEAPGALLGFALAPLSDFDGDGVTDFAASSPYFSDGDAGLFAGKVYVLSGADGSLLDSVQGLASGDLLGSSLAGVDLNGDGRKELLAGAIGSNGQRGSVRRYKWEGGGLRSAGAPFHGGASGELYGYALSNVGPLNRTPGEEFAVGAPFADDGGPESGAVEVRGRFDAQVYASLLLSAPGAHLGMSLDSGVDLNGDRRSELAVGAPDANAGTGEVMVWSLAPGTPLRIAIAGSTPGERFGLSLAWCGDSNRDGTPDLVIGAPYQIGAAGAVSVYNVEKVGLPQRLHAIFGAPGSRLGWSVAGLGTVYDGGLPAVAVGAPYAGARHGRVEIWVPPTPP